MAEQAVTAHAAREALYETIRKEVPFEQKAREALELGQKYLGADNGHLTRIDRKAGHWKAVVSTDPPDGRIPSGLELDLGTTYCRRVIEDNTQIALYDAPNQGWADDTAFETHGFHCYHGTPLIVDNEPFGTVCFVSEDPRGAFTDGEMMFAELIARLLERELERERHEAALMRQTNLATVLNRVLRHNLRNDLSVIRGYTQLVLDELDNKSYLQTALTNIDNLIRLSQKARQLDRVVGAESVRTSIDITELVERIANQVSQQYPGATITVEYDETITAAVLPSFEQALRELLENAAMHCGGSPLITVTVKNMHNAIEIQIADDGPGLANHEVEVLKTGTETPLIHGSGLGLWLTHWIVASHDGSIEPVVTDDGTTMTVVIPRESIGDLQQQLSKLSRAHDQYQAAFEGSNDAMILLNDNGQIIDANPEASEIYGTEQQALLGQPFEQFLPKSFDFDTAWRKFQNARRERDTVTIVRADGVTRQVEYSATADIVPGHHLVISRDITDRREREAELRTKTHAMDEAPVGITLSDPTQEDNPMVYANNHFCELTGYERDEILGQNCRFVQGKETDTATIAQISQAIDAQEPVTEIIRNYRNDGTAFWNEVTIAPITDETGELTNHVGFQVDVTDRIERKKALEETTQRLNAIIQASPDAIMALSVDGTIQLWNEAAEALFGYDAETAVGEQISTLSLHTKEQEAELKQRFKRALDGETLSNHETKGQTKGGEQIELHLSTAPITNEGGDITGVMVIAKHPDVAVGRNV